MTKGDSALREYFKEHLSKDEAILYGELNSKATAVYILFTLFFLLIISLILSFFSPLLKIIPTLLFFITFSQVMYFFNNRRKTFAITDSKVLISNRQKSIPISILYKNIQKVDYDGKHIYIHLNNIISNQVVLGNPVYLISSPSKGLRAYNTIHGEWISKSAFALLRKSLRSFAEKYNLKFQAFHSKMEYKIEGKIDGMDFNFTFYNVENLKYITSSIECKNEENNYISIRSEVMKDTFNKIMGIQDYIIGNTAFDDQFLLQTNYPPFLKYVLDDYMQESITQSMKRLKGQYLLGEKQKIDKGFKKKSFSENDILDDHLLGDNFYRKERTLNHTSILKYTSNRLNYDFDYEIIANDIVDNLELLLELADKINNYNK